MLVIIRILTIDSNKSLFTCIVQCAVVLGNVCVCVRLFSFASAPQRGLQLLPYMSS